MIADEKHIENMRSVAWLTYIAFIAGFVTGGLGFLIGIIAAYLKRGDARTTVYGSHFDFLIATFWWSIFWGLAGLATIFFLVGIAILIVLPFWVIYRLVRGVLAMVEEKPVY